MMIMMMFGLSCAETSRSGEERIIFLGDSITEQADEPGGFISIIKKSFTDNNRTTSIISAGVAGDKVTDVLARLKEDVLSKKPTTVILYIGINDVWHYTLGIGGTPKEEYRNTLAEIIRQIQSTGSRIILCTPSVIGEYFEPADSINSMLDEYCIISRDVAAASGIELCDLRKIFLEYLAANNTQQYIRGILTSDMVHLNSEGNALVAKSILPFLLTTP